MVAVVVLLTSYMRVCMRFHNVNVSSHSGEKNAILNEQLIYLHRFYFICFSWFFLTYLLSFDKQDHNFMNKNLEFTKAIRAQIKSSFYTSFPKYLYVQFGNFLIFHLSFLILFLLYCRQFFNRQFDTYLATTSLNVNVEFFIILLTL